MVPSPLCGGHRSVVDRCRGDVCGGAHRTEARSPGAIESPCDHVGDDGWALPARVGTLEPRLAQCHVVLMEVHRSSVFVNLLLLSFALPLFLDETRRSHRLSLPICLIVWCMAHDAHQHLTFGLLLLGLAALWIVTELRQRHDRSGLVLSALAGVFAIPATYFTLTAVEVEGGWGELLRTITRHPATMIALGIIVVLALIEIGGSRTTRSNSVSRRHDCPRSDTRRPGHWDFGAGQPECCDWH